MEYLGKTLKIVTIPSIILGLGMALKRSQQLISDPRLDVTIYSDSTYVVVLDSRLKEKGDVQYVWFQREENQYADKLCNDLMNTIYFVERLCNSLKNARCDVQSSSFDDS
ncbi:hypothetical protein BO83DRAFT_374204 [Aspergillus eucalypticola CBS 122712]|uniref:RNase H type-1 domain-containing protein n=1 Tax=Aspergillus eucalypticola (strain CBS 122712 / IBT 29274) TaxID=1448314 RepID=A0A317WG50_ASPEC|nr:uncharacterized protein BO83DRAFT_374204 [Aspergillus eucalypticola CBS 122712]PWY85444.1 hypothetical protein BO83DRAFT_374204 [Aspergillus eucalypticola CBS 122712]